MTYKTKKIVYSKVSNDQNKLNLYVEHSMILNQYFQTNS